MAVLSATDDTLLRALWDEHAGPLLGYASRLSNGDRGLAEDIVQETLLRAWRHPEAMDPQRGPLRPWLFTVARRIAIDMARARTARATEVGPEPLALLAAPDDIDRALESWAVSEALGSLSDDHRAVLLETYYRGSSVAEAASRLKIPPGTVKSRAYYALRELKLRLQERGVTA